MRKTCRVKVRTKRCKGGQDIDVNSDVDSDINIVNSDVNTANIDNSAPVDRSNLMSGCSVNISIFERKIEPIKVLISQEIELQIWNF